MMLLLLGLAGCAGGSTEPNTTTPVAAEGPQLTIEGRSFGSAPSLAPGETMTIVNLDGVRHTFTSRDDLWEPVAIPGDSEMEFTVPTELAPGQYIFFCEVHPDMGGSITIGG